MRRLNILLAAGLLAFPVVSEAKTLNELLVEKGVISADDMNSANHGKVHYKDGTRLEFGDDLSLKMNLRIKARYSYDDYEDASLRGMTDTSSIEVPQARVEFKGHALSKKVSFKLQNDFMSNRGTGLIKDIWLQMNFDKSAMVRAGQFKVPFGRQETNSSTKIQFIRRANVSDDLTYGRNQGAMLHGKLGDQANYALGIFNGTSTGEGAANGSTTGTGTDNEHLGAAHFNASLVGDYDRSFEGDPYNSDFSVGMGASATYGSGNNAMGDFDEWGVAVDLGTRVRGFSFQTEFLYRGMDIDGVSGSAGEQDDYGLWAQTGYFFVPEEWEVAARFGWHSYDDDVSAIDDEYEYGFVLGYFMRGHDIKFQTGITWVDTNTAAGGSDTLDFRYEAQMLGYF